MIGSTGILTINIALVILLAIISATIVAVADVRLGILIKQSKEGNKKAKWVIDILEEDSGKIMLGLQLGHSICSILVGGLTAIWSLSAMPNLPFRFEYSLCVAIMVVVAVGDIIPGVLAGINPEASCLILYPALKIVKIIFLPIINFFTWVFAPLLSKLKPKEEETLEVAEEEIKRIVEEGQEMGVLEEEETKMIHSIFDFGETIAREVMVPRVDMVCAKKDTPVIEIMKLISQSGFSRIPIYEDSIDKIIGIVYSRDLLSYVSCENLYAPASEVARTPPYFVPATKYVSELLREMRKKSISIAIVVDEYGGTDGLVTVEDILEEIVGEITDEHDKETPSIISCENGAYIVDGSTIIEDVNVELDINIPPTEQETIGGFVYATLGHIPTQGEKVTLEDLGIEITVEKIKGQRITSLLIKKIQKDIEED